MIKATYAEQRNKAYHILPRLVLKCLKEEICLTKWCLNKLTAPERVIPAPRMNGPRRLVRMPFSPKHAPNASIASWKRTRDPGIRATMPRTSWPRIERNVLCHRYFFWSAYNTLSMEYTHWVSFDPNKDRTYELQTGKSYVYMLWIVHHVTGPAYSLPWVYSSVARMSGRKWPLMWLKRSRIWTCVEI